MVVKPEQTWIELAVVTQPHGVDGRLKIKSFTDPADAFAGYAGLTDEGGRPVKLHVTGQAKGQFIAKVTGVNSRDDAEQWKGKKLGVARTALKEIAKPDRYYITDLIGMKVFDKAGAALGKVRQVFNFGAGDILEIEDRTGETEFFAFTRETFPQVDASARRITMVRPQILGSREEENDA